MSISIMTIEPDDGCKLFIEEYLRYSHEPRKCNLIRCRFLRLVSIIEFANQIMSSNRNPATKSFYNPKTRIWSGSKAPLLYDANQTIGQIVLENLLKRPENIAQICHHNGKHYTNQQIATYSIRVAQKLDKLGVGESDIIGICACNSDYLAPLFFGAMLQGCVVSSLDPSFEKDGVKHIYSMTKPKLMFCDGSNYARVKEALQELGLNTRIYTMIDHLEGVPQIMEFFEESGSEKDFKLKTFKNAGDHTAAILCSSGTTGLPKGVCLSNSTLLNASFNPLKDGDSLTCFSTIYWLSGVVCLLSGTINGATRIIHSKGFSPKVFFEIIQTYRVSSVLTPPSQIALSLASEDIKNYDLSSVETYMTGGSAIPFTLIQKLKPYFPNAQIFAAYGSTEIGSCTTYGVIHSEGSNGQLVSYVEAKIVDSSGESLEPTKVGEVWVRTPFQWSGYFGNPKATADIYDEDKWIHTGDLGYFSSQGDLFIIDRIKDICKYNNFHFFPSEIEKVINEMAGVREVCVCGIPDIVSTHLPAAAIVRSPDSNLTEEEVFNYVAERMDHFKQLKGGVYFVEDLPQTPSGKNKRREVTSLCEKLRLQKVSSS